MAVPDNIAGLVITDGDLSARFPGLAEYRSPSQPDWSPQLTSGKADALEAFRVAKNQDPERAQAVDDGDWKRILTFFTIAVCVRGFGPEWADESARWRSAGYEALDRFLYRYDENDDGDIDEDLSDEEPQRIHEIILRRG